ncbi:MAG: phosphoribosyltransferase family protein [Bacteroidota bacterium]
MELLDDLLNMLFPVPCAACGNTLFKNENILCLFCQFQLPQTNFHNFRDNQVEKVFWGRVPLNAVASLYYFRKGGKVQHLVHQFKYKNRKEIGIYLGKMYGNILLNSERFNTIEAILPVPLHTSKLKKRGYNQSEVFAQGLSESMNKPVDNKTLIRKNASETQTRKTRFKRWENVKEIFSLENSVIYQNKHILLVDDVITTGATIEACVNELNKTDGIKISVASIACTASLN